MKGFFWGRDQRHDKDDKGQKGVRKKHDPKVEPIGHKASSNGPDGISGRRDTHEAAHDAATLIRPHLLDTRYFPTDHPDAIACAG